VEGAPPGTVRRLLGVIASQILVAGDSAADAEQVRALLRDEFDEIAVSTEPERAISDFEKHRPAVLILAFNTLEKAQRYYLGLYRLCSVVHALPHRTVILCNTDDVRRVYELCKKEYFDDYVLFLPIAQGACSTFTPQPAHCTCRMRYINSTAKPHTGMNSKPRSGSWS
jgi:CheY-like chemotaxis protein